MDRRGEPADGSQAAESRGRQRKYHMDGGVAGNHRPAWQSKVWFGGDGYFRPTNERGIISAVQTGEKIRCVDGLDSTREGGRQAVVERRPEPEQQRSQAHRNLARANGVEPG